MEKPKRKSGDLVVVEIVLERDCAGCGKELGRGALVKVEGDKSPCMECADLDHLMYLPRGNAALTRRAGKYSGLRAVVVKFSRARKRYERQAVLVEEAALTRAEGECLADAELREARRLREAVRRAEIDEQYVAEFARRVRERYPGIPAGEEDEIARHAAQKYSGRVGRTAGAKRFENEAIDLAVVAHVRHCWTDYDELLMRGEERHEARAMIRGEIDEVLGRWSEAGWKG